MGWLDDARKKAEDTAEEAKAKAAEKAAEAAVAAAGAAVSKSVGGFFEGIVASAEAALADAEQSASGRSTLIPPVEDLEAIETQIESDLASPAPDPLGAALRAKEREVLEEEPTEVTAPPPVGRPARDPFAAAHAAIAASRAARGLDPHEPEPVIPARPKDPVAAALAAAEEARAFARSGGSAGLAREQAARDQLAALKAGRGSLSSPQSDRKDDGDDTAPPSSGKRRTL